MAECIDRNAAIKAICEKECDALKPCKAECESLWAVKELPTIDPQPKWIPVTERLPNIEDDVLVTVHFLGLEQKHPNGWNDHIKENYYVDIACQIDGEWISYSDEYKVARNMHVVVSWMPLPEPYKGDATDSNEDYTPVNLSGVYRCDPEKNTECTKEGCHINGGECWLTAKREYWKVDE